MTNEQAVAATVDLTSSSLLVMYLQSQARPLSAAQWGSARALQQQLCAAPWANPEERGRAHGLVVRLALLLGQ
jgi:hypothetical protein